MGKDKYGRGFGFMRMYDIILKKREGMELSAEEIDYFVKGYVAGDIPDYQVSALLMAIYFRGLSKKETADLTKSMVNSGQVVNLSSIRGVKVDKHSTGGVGDTTTLIAVPLVAACDVKVAKMSGRGLGHTGGTLDKLESIPGFNVSISIDEFVDIVNRVGAAVIGQTKDLVPADKKLYALRDVTATVDNISLIASSIMSKKIASGADAIVLDVKTGSGAFMKTLEDSFALAKEMVDIGIRTGRKTTAIVTDMDQPLGMTIGNSLEVKEAIEVLNGSVKGSLREVSLILASYMLYTAGRCAQVKEARALLEQVLNSGRGLQKLAEIIQAQGGDEKVVWDTSRLPMAKHSICIKSEKEGYISAIKAQEIGTSALILGAGRATKEDVIDPAAGIVMKKRIGDYVNRGEEIASFHVNDDKHIDEAIARFYNAVNIQKQKPQTRPLVYGVVTEAGIDRWA